MLRRTLSSAVAAAASTLAPSAVTATAASCEGECAAATEYCDSFVDECRRCSDICHKDGSFRECEEKCEGYLRSAVFREEKMGSELVTLQGREQPSDVTAVKHGSEIRRQNRVLRTCFVLIALAS